jgi:hypothetical protein
MTVVIESVAAMIRFRERLMLSGWERLSSDELFELHQEMQSVLREKLIAKRKMLEDQLRRLNQGSDIRLKDSRT